MAALPLAVASAGPVGDPDPATARTSDDRSRASDGGSRASDDRSRAPDDAVRASGARDSDDAPAAVGRADAGAGAPESRPTPSRSPLTLGLGIATAARCGPELASPDGIEAQTCVLTQGRDTWARTYYRNATGDDLTSVLTLMGPADRTVRMHCAVGADDEPGVCETPRQRTTGDVRAYTAVVEFAEGADGPLLLRAGSNSPAQTGR
ncbi:hypothetical protein [Streptomyces sp. NBC_00878]|uniref:hypothetical protein n=1 Tax=Streptomyces sp. NBC_00878 TaxID=2975854 RepID=UPI00225877E1|nr:hypothetical protein [Streptomyces sp. NBC_00878]MCX4907070.1 hypothetical protein [Streptomyces sp. NBC_00878]